MPLPPDYDAAKMLRAEDHCHESESAKMRGEGKVAARKEAKSARVMTRNELDERSSAG